MVEEITAHDFDTFANNHILSSYHESSNYATLMSRSGYERVYLGYKNESGNIVAATLLLTKKIKHLFKYGYAPKGFLIDYKNEKLLTSFTDAIKKYASKEKIIFIKINPEIPTYLINAETKEKTKLSNGIITSYLTERGYIKLKDNLYFESMLPRFNGIMDLEKLDIKKYSKNTKNKINNATRKGLEIVVSSENKVKELYPFIEMKKKRRTIKYYNNYFNIFHDEGAANIFLVKINYNTFLENSKRIFEDELERNRKLTERMFKKNTPENINKKMESDRELASFKNDVINATYGNNNDPNEFIAGALCVTYKDRAYIVISGFNQIYGNMNPNYFLHNEIFKYYKNKGLKYVDLNGLTGDFTKNNPYYGLNHFKLGFNPYMYELIGEFDLVVDKNKYEFLLSLGLIQKEFKKD